MLASGQLHLIGKGTVSGREVLRLTGSEPRPRPTSVSSGAAYPVEYDVEPETYAPVRVTVEKVGVDALGNAGTLTEITRRHSIRTAAAQRNNSWATAHRNDRASSHPSPTQPVRATATWGWSGERRNRQSRRKGRPIRRTPLAPLRRSTGTPEGSARASGLSIRTGAAPSARALAARRRFGIASRSVGTCSWKSQGTCTGALEALSANGSLSRSTQGCISSSRHALPDLGSPEAVAS